MSKSNDKNGKLACAGAGGSLGLAALAGACTTGCSLAAAPLFVFLSSMGLGGVAAFLPGLRIPLVLMALALGLFAIRTFIRSKNVIGAALCGCALGVGGAFLGWQMTQANDCKSASTMEKVLASLSPQAKEVFQKGVYPLWPELGRAPTVEEVQKKLGFKTIEPVLAAFHELGSSEEIFYPGTNTIKWLWPFSSMDHGVEVTLEGSKPVHARCAIDSLGVSAMFGKIAKITIRSHLDERPIEMEINGDKIVKADSSVVVSYGESCDDMLFFSSRDEFDRYVKKTGKNYLTLYTLPEALRHGIYSFGKALKV